MPKRSKKGASYYKQKADGLFSQYVRRRDGCCLRCGKTESLQCAHIIGRRNHRLRYDPQNAITLCYACHIHFAHKEPVAFTRWLEETRPEQLRYLESHQNEIEQRKLFDYQELVTELRSMLSSLNNS